MASDGRDFLRHIWVNGLSRVKLEVRGTGCSDITDKLNLDFPNSWRTGKSHHGNPGINGSMGKWRLVRTSRSL